MLSHMHDSTELTRPAGEIRRRLFGSRTPRHNARKSCTRFPEYASGYETTHHRTTAYSITSRNTPTKSRSFYRSDVLKWAGTNWDSPDHLRTWGFRTQKSVNLERHTKSILTQRDDLDADLQVCERKSDLVSCVPPVRKGWV